MTTRDVDFCLMSDRVCGHGILHSSQRSLHSFQPIRLRDIVHHTRRNTVLSKIDHMGALYHAAAHKSGMDLRYLQSKHLLARLTIYLTRLRDITELLRTTPLGRMVADVTRMGTRARGCIPRVRGKNI